jgi:hypothetical protein
MPPRFAYWTILIDGKPTAFRARDPQELLPTLTQLKRTNTDVLMRWFARGHLWESPEAERAAARKPKPPETRGRDWRPGGQHRDPRARFKKTSADRDRGHREHPAASRPPSFGKRPPSNARRTPNTPPAGEPPHGGRPPIQRPLGPPPRQDRPQFARNAARRPPSAWREKDRPREPHEPGSPPASRAPSKRRDPRKRR